MSDRLDVNELLMLARETLQNELAPGLPAGARFTAALIANALAIAARETLDHSAAELDIAGAREELPEFADDRKLIAAIRSGALDERSPRRLAAVAYAAALVRRRLAVTNPAYERTHDETPS
jgi:hypothetical protein